MVGRHRDRVERDATVLDEVAVGRRQEADAGATLFELHRRTFVDDDSVTGVGEQACGGQPAERPSDDGDVHVDLGSVARASGLTEGGDLVDRALEQHSPLVDRRIAQAVRAGLLRCTSSRSCRGAR